MKLFRSLASYSPWANIAPGVFLLLGQARKFIRRNNVILKYLILGITVVYVVTVIILYLKPGKSAWRLMVPPRIRPRFRPIPHPSSLFSRFLINDCWSTPVTHRDQNDCVYNGSKNIFRFIRLTASSIFDWRDWMAHAYKFSEPQDDSGFSGKLSGQIRVR